MAWGERSIGGVRVLALRLRAAQADLKLDPDGTQTERLKL